MKKIHITRLATIASAIALSSTAIAADKKANVTDPSTLMKFENVRVVNAIAATNAVASTGEVGMRAYIDPNTKQLRAATAEDRAAASVATKAKVGAAVAAKRGVAAASATSGVVATRLSNGALKLAVDESRLSYSVARVAADGSVKEDCVTGEKDADKLMESAVATPGAGRNEK